MNTHELFSKFSQGLNWNALLYTTYKLLFTLLSFMLFNTLTTTDFSCWANINSTVFLLLLWLDFGFRKSVPRYSPEFVKDSQANKKFISAIILFQSLVLVSSIPLLQFFLKIIIQTLNQPKTPVIILGSMLFITEGIIAILRLIYHSYFLHKQFNLLAIIFMIIEMVINITLIYTISQSSILLTVILINKIIVNTIIGIISSIMLVKIIPSPIATPTKINIHQITRKFIKHSAIMWINNNLKSLSERNFFIPFITYTMGPVLANSFKIANDAALLFYRIVIKTIGTTDTLLLAHIVTLKQKKLMQFAFTKLTTKVTRLCLPLLGIVLFLAIKGNTSTQNPFVFHLFIIMAIGYLIETMFLPYERILEVNNKYKYLALAYIPYVVMLISIFSGITMPFFGLLGSIMIVHSVRLVSLSMIIYFVYEYHRTYVIDNLYAPIKDIFAFFSFLKNFFIFPLKTFKFFPFKVFKSN